MRISKYKNLFNKEQVEKAASGSSIAEFLKNLGMKVNNGNYRQAEKIASEFGVSLPKFNFNSAMKQVCENFNRISNEDFFIFGTLRNGSNLKKRMINDYGIEEKCSIPLCPIETPVWCGKPLTLQVDHVDGNKFNNKLENLRLICPNCHTQTKTYGNINKSKSYNYCSCGVRILKQSKFCNSCTPKKRKISYPPVETILKLLKNSSFVKVGKQLGVSDNAIRKHLKSNGIEIRSRKKQ